MQPTLYNMRNITNYIRALLLIVLLSIETSVQAAQPVVVSDSLMNQIQQNEGKNKLKAFYSACMQAATRNNVKDEIALLRAYQAEASRQKDVEHEMQARVLRLYAFYNNNLPDSLNACIQNDLQFLEQHRQWDYYYSCRSLIVEKLRYANRLQSALREAQAMYEDARQKDINYGKGISAYLIASCYQNMNRNSEAIEFFKQAESYLAKEENAGQLHNMYGIAWESYAATEQWDELLKLTDRWEKMWKTYCQKNKLQLSDIAPYYVVCLLAKAHAHIDKKELPDARKLLDQATLLARGQRDMALMLLFKEEARYEEVAGNHERALSWLDECLRMQTEQDNKVGILSTEERRAGLLLKIGQYEASARIFANLQPRKDSLSRLDMAAQLDDLSTIYKVDTLKMENAQFRLWMIIAAIGCGVLVLLLAGYLYYHRRMLAKNRAIVQQYQKQKQTEELMEKLLYQQSADKVVTDPDSLLFLRIRKLLQDKSLLTNPVLERRLLAEMLNTNYTYIANAIQAGAGISVKKYITQARIDYACELLREGSRYSISEIQDKCGFQSSTTFNRTFKEYMHMTPTDFQKEASENPSDFS